MENHSFDADVGLYYELASMDVDAVLMAASLC
jgi:hypothetical protein